MGRTYAAPNFLELGLNQKTFLQALEPSGNDWTRGARYGAAQAWRRGPVCVLSELCNAVYPDGSGCGPQWLISITHKGRRPKAHDVRGALRAFAMVGAEEDNHHPGHARHFWRPVDPAKRVKCSCKSDETVVIEKDGYRWQNNRPESGPCRGCEWARMTGTQCKVCEGKSEFTQGQSVETENR